MPVVVAMNLLPIAPYWKPSAITTPEVVWLEESIMTLLSNFVQLFVESAPWLMLGLLVAAVVPAHLDTQVIQIAFVT